jgi:hypothetical protein
MLYGRSARGRPWSQPELGTNMVSLRAPNRPLSGSMAFLDHLGLYTVRSKIQGKGQEPTQRGSPMSPRVHCLPPGPGSVGRLLLLGWCPLRRPSVLNKGRPKSPSGQCWCIWRGVRCAGLLVRIMRRLVMTLMRWLSLFAFFCLHRRSIPERARVADGDGQLRLKPLTHRALPSAFEQQYYENLRSVLNFIS